MELERLFLTDRPTLFIGEIEDITTLDQEYYILRIGIINPHRANLEVSMKSSKQKVDSLLKENPNLIRGYPSGVAVIGKIDNIKAVGDKNDIRIGEGKAIDIIYVEDLKIWYYRDL